MKTKNSFFVTMLLLTLFTWGRMSAADLPTISPADGSADVWYHIRLEQRIWGIWGYTSTLNGGEKKGYYLDEGLGKMLRNIEDTVNVPATRWKIVATDVSDEYQLISGLGNTIDYSASGIGNILGDRFYTTTLDAQVFTIKPDNGAYLGLSLKGIGGIDKSNRDLYFDKYGPDAAGGAITFVAAEPLKKTIIQLPVSLDLGDVAVGAKRTKMLAFMGAELSDELSYSIDGDGFTVIPGVSTANGGTVEITFTPTELKTYTATLTISDGDVFVTTTLKGESDYNFNFPLQISEAGGEEHWYYIQFNRQAGNKKVWQANPDKSAVQASIESGDKQLWKIVGDWDNYRIVNKAGDDLELKYISDRYAMSDAGSGDLFGFEPFGSTGDWELKNYGISGNQSYINDRTSYIANYLKNDVGNRVIFIPVSAHSLVVEHNAIDFGSSEINLGPSITKTIFVLGVDITGDISAVIEGEGKDAFSLTQTTLPLTGGNFEITFTPLAIDIYKAQLILSSPGVEDVTVQLTARGSMLPFLISSDDDADEHWYYVQFTRKPAWAITAQGMNAKVKQTDWSRNQAINEAQIWKITGTQNNFKFVSKTGGELAVVSGTEYTLETTGDPHTAIERTSGNITGWGFRNVTKNNDMNDFNPGVGLWGMDDGGPLNFIPVAGIVPDAATLAYGNVTTGLKGVKTLTVSGKETTDPITYTLSGSGAGSFKVANTTAVAAANDPLPATGGTLNISFEPDATGEYMATLTLQSTGSPDVIITLTGSCIDLPADFPVKISDATNTTWYTVYFNRSYTSGYSWRVWTAGLRGEAIKQTAQSGREDPNMTTEEQLWKFVVDPSRTGYLAVSYSKLEATTGDDYTLEKQGKGTPLLFVKNSAGAWIMRNIALDISLNDRNQNTVCNYSYNGSDPGCPMGFIETPLPPPGIIPNVTTLAFSNVTTGLKGEKTLTVSGRQTIAPITYTLSGPDAGLFKVANITSGGASLPVAGGKLNISFEPVATGDYAATLTLRSNGAPDIVVALTGNCVALPADFPVKISDATNTTWYTVYFNRSYTSGYSWRVWTADFEGDAIKQTAQVGRNNPKQTAEKQLWKFIIAPSKTGYLAVSFSDLEATTGNDYTLEGSGKGTPLLFAKNPAGAWILKNIAANISLNDRSQNTVCNYSSNGSDAGCPMGFIETAPPLAYCGDDLWWTFSDESTLTINGTGEMTNYAAPNDVPWSYYRSSVTKVILTDNVTSIGNNAFAGCNNLPSIIIPGSVTSIGTSVFYNCESLSAIDVDESNVAYVSEEGVLFNKAKTALIRYPAGKTDASFDIPEGVTDISDYAFEGCTALTALTNLNATPQAITAGVFEGVDVSNITLYVPLGSMNDYKADPVWRNFKIEEMPAIGQCGDEVWWELLPNGTLTITGTWNMWDFSATKDAPWKHNCASITEVIVEAGVTSIGNWAFVGCTGIVSLTIPAEIISIGSSAFAGCSNLATVNFNAENCTYMGSSTYPTFAGCEALTAFNIGDGVRTIPEHALSGCRSLPSITIPQSVTVIGNAAFMGCTGLMSVTNLNPTPQTINANVFGSVNIGIATLHVPAESVETYKVTNVWKDFGTIKAAYTSIDAPGAANVVRISPNPVVESFRIEGITVPTQVTVTDIAGRIVFRRTVGANESIVVAHWPQGVYLVGVNGETVKIIKN
jgi:hypothetical protein